MFKGVDCGAGMAGVCEAHFGIPDGGDDGGGDGGCEEAEDVEPVDGACLSYLFAGVGNSGEKGC